MSARVAAYRAHGYAVGDPDFIRLGRELRRRRERHPDLTLRDVSARCNLSETYYGMIERGQRLPHPKVLDRILLELQASARETAAARTIFRQVVHARTDRRLRGGRVAERPEGNEPDEGAAGPPPGPLEVAAVVPEFLMDASVLAKPFTRHREADVDKVILLLQRHSLRRCRLLAPELARLEILNAVRFSRGADRAATTEALEILRDIGIDFIPLDHDVLERAVGLAWTHGLSIYDAIYLGHAEALGIALVSADAKFHASVRGHPLVRRLGDLNVP